MSVLIKGMKMPKDGTYWCEIGVAGDIAMITIHGENRKSFHLVPVSPHGDLIDVEVQLQLMEACEYDTYDDYKRAFDMLDNAPTIIPAERRGEEDDIC